ncbi:MAG: peptide chain release factor N(5)-glutamine methyltransferase [Candidatus Saccharibacteria bacterium]
MTIREALNTGAKMIRQSGGHLSPVLDSEVLLCFALKTDKARLLTDPDRKVGARTLKRFLALAKKRGTGVPVAYLTGSKEFCGLDFSVNRGVLIPRPETEGLVEELSSRLNGLRDMDILDIGTGSGCIVVSLAKKLPGNRFFASDVSGSALTVAKRNAKRHRAKITFKKSDLLSGWGKMDFDVIIANLPYGWKAWKNDSSAETRGLKYEPGKALFTGDGGLFLIKKLFRQVVLKRRPFMVAIEFDPRQAKKIKSLTSGLSGFKTEVLEDLAGKPRFAVSVRKFS